MKIFVSLGERSASNYVYNIFKDIKGIDLYGITDERLESIGFKRLREALGGKGAIERLRALFLQILIKPCGLVVHPSPGYTSGTLVIALLYHVKNLSSIGGVERPGIVHRLEKTPWAL